MGVGKCRVYLDGPGVALHGSIDVLHLLEGVAHVAVGVCEVWVDSDGLLVVAEGLLEPTLHLEDAGEIGVSRGKLWVDLREGGRGIEREREGEAERGRGTERETT